MSLCGIVSKLLYKNDLVLLENLATNYCKIGEQDSVQNTSVRNALEYDTLRNKYCKCIATYIMNANDYELYLMNEYVINYLQECCLIDKEDVAQLNNVDINALGFLRMWLLMNLTNGEIEHYI